MAMRQDDDGRITPTTWPDAPDDPRWRELVELAGGDDACRSAMAEHDGPRYTLDDVRRARERKRNG